MKPVIVVVGEDGFDQMSGNQHFVINKSYCEKIRLAGGMPVVALDIRMAEEYANIGDGLLLTGGPNMHAARYGGIYKNSEEMVGFSATRDDMDFALMKQFDEKGKPVFGIGRGLEVMNVYFGGDLCADINQNHKEANMHTVNIEEETLLYKLYGKQSIQNSFHTQSINKLGSGMKATAFSQDGVIEAAEHLEKKMFGVMWHPERDFGESKAQIQLFEYFVNSADRRCEV